MPFQPYAYQSSAIAEMSRRTNERTDWLLISPPGSGKTNMCLAWLRNSEGITWVVVHESDLGTQWLQNLAKFFSDDEYCCLATRSTIGEDYREFVGLRPGVKIVVCMDKQITPERMTEAETLGLVPDRLCLDEFHLTITHEGVRRARVWGYENHGSNFVLCGLTGTPVSHENNYVHPIDIVPHDQWILPVDGASLTRDGYWSKQQYMSVDPGYLAKAELAFAGNWEGDDEQTVLSTAGRLVMKGLLEDHLRMLSSVERRTNDVGQKESFMIFCADIAHAEEIAERMSQVWPFPVLSVTSRTKAADRQKILEDVQSGDIGAVCVVGCWLSGMDIPSVCSSFFLSPHNSAPKFGQMATRSIRLYGGLSARYFDWALNFGKHPLIADMDFADVTFVRSDDDGFRDSKSRICQQPTCLSVSPAFPHPRPPNLSTGMPAPKARIATGLYADGTPIGHTDKVCCPTCGAAMMVLEGDLNEYVDWKADGSDMDDQPKSMGLVLGGTEGFPATYGMLLSCGFYRGKPMGRGESDKKAGLVDRSEEWKAKTRTCEGAFLRAKQIGKIRELLPSSTSRIIGISKASLQAKKCESFDSFEKVLRIQLLQSLENAGSILEPISECLQYSGPAPIYAVDDQDDSKAIVVGKAEQIPMGYTRRSGLPEELARICFLKNLSAMLFQIGKESLNSPELFDVAEGWISSPMRQAEDLLRTTMRASGLKAKDLTGGTDSYSVNRCRHLRGQIELLRSAFDAAVETQQKVSNFHDNYSDFRD